MNILESTRILVIGGSSGIGAATAAKFVGHGANVTIASRNAEKLAAASLTFSGKVDTAVIDTTKDAAVESFFCTHAPFDHIVISAAQTPTGALRELSLADARAAMESKFWGAYRVARAANITDNGSLTFVSGFLSVRPSKTSVLQGAINAALEALARGLALELAPIRVNTVSPGLIDTALWSRLSDASRDAMYKSAAARLPVRRVGLPEDVANAILFLATTSYTTGSTVLVDGGGAIA